MRGRAGRALAVAMCAAAVTTGLTGCDSGAAATAETQTVKHLEARIASYTESHSQVISAAGADQPGACAVRVLGRPSEAHHTQKAYIELFCSSVSRDTGCPTSSSSAGVGAAVATLAADQGVTGVAVDDENDEAYYQWINKRFPADLRHLRITDRNTASC